MMPANDPGSFAYKREDEEDDAMVKSKGRELLSRKMSEMKEENYDG